MRQIINFIEEKSGGKEQELGWKEFLHGIAQNGENSDNAVETALKTSTALGLQLFDSG